MIDPPRRIAAAVTGVGVVLCVIGWYQIAGQPTVPQQLPYLASATIPGAALLAVGLVLLLRTAPAHDAARTVGMPGPAAPGLWQVPDGRYLHSADCPLLDGRTDLTAAEEPDGVDGSNSGLRPCPLCRANAADPDPDPER
jgi:hypothetical protein